MWGTFLSEPLRIVALVGRYPANKLMRRMPIHRRIAPLIPGRCLPEMLRGIRRNFFRLSPLRWAGCIRVTHPCAGRRRLKQASAPLPLDLHVLSLSLAFILSQDQTLRCCILSFSFQIKKSKISRICLPKAFRFLTRIPKESLTDPMPPDEPSYCAVQVEI